MGFNIYIFIIAVIIVGLYFYMNKNKEKKYEEKRYDLILLEDDIKPLSGLIIMKKLFMIKSFNTKVILLTKNNEYKDSYKEYGFSDVILKPIDEEIFNNIIDKYLK